MDLCVDEGCQFFRVLLHGHLVDLVESAIDVFESLQILRPGIFEQDRIKGDACHVVLVFAMQLQGCQRVEDDLVSLLFVAVDAGLPGED